MLLASWQRESGKSLKDRSSNPFALVFHVAAVRALVREICLKRAVRVRVNVYTEPAASMKSVLVIHRPIRVASLEQMLTRVTSAAARSCSRCGRVRRFCVTEAVPVLAAPWTTEGGTVVFSRAGRDGADLPMVGSTTRKSCRRSENGGFPGTQAGCTAP